MRYDDPVVFAAVAVFVFTVLTVTFWKATAEWRGFWKIERRRVRRREKGR